MLARVNTLNECRNKKARKEDQPRTCLMFSLAFVRLMRRPAPCEQEFQLWLFPLPKVMNDLHAPTLSRELTGVSDC